MKPTFTPVIIPSQKRADGSYNVKIRVTYKRKSKRISTHLYAEKKDLTKELEFKEGPVRRKAYDIAKDMQDICAEIDFLELQGMEVDDLIKVIDAKAETKKKFRLDFIEYMREKAKSKGPSEKIYNTSANALARFMNGHTLDISDITVKFLRSFEEFLSKEPKIVSNFHEGSTWVSNIPKGGRAASQYLGCIRHVYGLARKEFNEPDLDIFRIPNNPFEYYDVPKQQPAKRRNKSKEFIQMIIDECAKAKGAEKFALEIFVLSFALEGINLADLYTCAPAKGRWLVYNRKKTKGRRADDAEHHVYISDEIMPIVEKNMDYDGIHMFSFHRRYKDFNAFTLSANNAIRRWREDHKDVEDFTMYAARHSFASIARRIGIEKATIDEMLCHVGNLRMADVYIEPDWDIHRRANEKLLAEFDWSAIK